MQDRAGLTPAKLPQNGRSTPALLDAQVQIANLSYHLNKIEIVDVDLR
jgi:hypothetical protein